MNDQERAAYDFLIQGHSMAKSMGLTDPEICKISTTNGDIPPAAMKAYCEKFNHPVPSWAVAETKMFGGPTGF